MSVHEKLQPLAVCLFSFNDRMILKEREDPTNLTSIQIQYIVVQTVRRITR